MKGTKQYRFEDNPKEKEFHDKFIEMMTRDIPARKSLDAIIFGWKEHNQHSPKDYLTKREEVICVNLIQWLGSPVGQSFLRDCGFDLRDSELF